MQPRHRPGALRRTIVLAFAAGLMIGVLAAGANLGLLNALPGIGDDRPSGATSSGASGGNCSASGAIAVGANIGGDCSGPARADREREADCGGGRGVVDINVRVGDETVRICRDE